MIRNIKLKKLFAFMCVFFMLMGIFVKSETIEAQAVDGTHGTLSYSTGNYNYIELTVKLYNHDQSTINSYTITCKDGDNVIETWSVDFTTESYSDSKKHTFYNLTSHKAYSFEYSIDTPYAAHVLDPEDGYTMRIYCLERLEVTKTWDDNNNELNHRPTAGEYINKMTFYENGVKVTPKDIKIIPGSEDEDTYSYYVYGINIRHAIEVGEEPVPDYELSEAKGSDAFFGTDVFGDERMTFNKNVSIASLKNKDFVPLNIKLTKTDYDNHDPLENVEFEIINVSGKDISYNSQTYRNNEVIATIKTDADGKASIKDLPSSGIYLVKETNNPIIGYIPPTYERTISFADVGEDKHTVNLGEITNKKSGFGGLKVIKVDENDNNIKLPNAVFELYNISGETIVLNDDNNTQVENNGLIETYTTGDEGYFETGYILPNDGLYKLVEVTPPAKYLIIEEEKTVCVSKDATNEVTVLNRPITYAGLRIVKKDDNNGRLLSGAEFDVYYIGENPITVADGIVYNNGDVIFSGLVTDENGIAETEKILPVESAVNGDNYKIVETKHPDNYKEPNGATQVNINKDKLNQEYYYEQTIYNYRDVFCIEISKLKYPFEPTNSEDKDTFEFEVELKDKEGNPVNESFYLVHNADMYHKNYNRDLEYSGIEKITFVDGKASVTVGFDDMATICDIPNGYKYTVTEKENTDWSLFARKNYTMGYNYGNYGHHEIFVNKKEEDISLNFEAQKVLENATLQDKQFEFELKDSNNKVLDNQYNDSDGNVTFKDITVNTKDFEVKKLNYKNATEEQKKKYDYWVCTDHSNVNYILTKNIPDEACIGYNTDRVEYKYASDEQKAQLGTNNFWRYEVGHYGESNFSTTVGFYDLNYFDLSEIENIETLLDTEMNFYAYYYDEELTYTINEVKAKDNNIAYDDHIEIVKVKINGELGKELSLEYLYDSDKATFINTQKTDIEISKTDLGGSELPGAEIQILLDDEVIEEWTSTEKPHVLYLLPGKYTFHEVSAPNGYQKVTDIIFEVDEDGNVIVEEIKGIVTSQGNKLIVIDKELPKLDKPKEVLPKSDKPDVPYTIPKTGVE